jgi:hypothetical protein
MICFPLGMPDSRSVYECKRMEAILQERYQHLELGRRRLWFIAGAGDDYLDEYGTEVQPAKVYLTVHLDIQPLLDDGGTLILGTTG